MTKRLLFASLLINVLLAAGLAWLWRQAPEATAPPPGARAPSKTPATATALPSPPPARVASVLAAPALDWEALRGTGLKEYDENLRALGLPDNVVRALVRAAVDERYDQRIVALMRPTGEFEFWKTGRDAFKQFVPDGDRMRQRDALLAEKRAVLIDLLGSEGDRRLADQLSRREQMVDAMLGFLPADKKRAVDDLVREFESRQMDLARDEGKDSRSAYRWQMLALEKEQAIRDLLDADEFERYLLTTSQTANGLRSRLTGFEPSRDEFLTLFRMQKEFDDYWLEQGANGEAREDVHQQRTAGTEALNERIRAALGERRYRDYERSQDHNFRSLYEAANAERIDRSSIIAAYDVLTDTRRRVDELLKMSDLSREERRAALVALEQEARASARSLFGAAGEDSLAIKRFELLSRFSRRVPGAK